MSLLTYLRARACERSTWSFWLGCIGSYALLPVPANLIFAGVLLCAGFLPDRNGNG